MKKFLLLLAALLTGAVSPILADSAYPLTTCLVSGKPLDSMGGPFVFRHEGTEVRLCCENCRPKFEKNAARYLKVLEDAAK